MLEDRKNSNCYAEFRIPKSVDITFFKLHNPIDNFTNNASSQGKMNVMRLGFFKKNRFIIREP
jgi:hypothetical protein